ncbi:hypothetical protein HNS38_16355 [Lentimicrobium sp. L6]|uniref:hypothetical protein n=1 Tax=Lentimicrobium sp. L6 TaxID=2735916 RepID=UPI0015558EBD|nr:hypothetical protein [Lentimicrobium sp. L6]NPD86347.1 hypothetical protein [Lentimicrobium sp. L6]
MKTKILLITALLISFFAFYSCEKTEDTQAENQELIDSGESDIIEDVLWNAIDSDIDYAGNILESNGYKSVTDTCPLIIVEHPDSVFFPRTITIDYGDSYCETYHGALKKGKIVIEITAPIQYPGSFRSISFEEFYINEHKIEGAKTLINKGLNDAENLNFEATLTGGKITFPDGRASTRESIHNREWTKGIENPTYWWDNEWLLTGGSTGTHRDGKTYVNTITEPILVKAMCHFAVSGTMELLIQNQFLLVLDFGDGECDRIATLTFGDLVWEIELD